MANIKSAKKRILVNETKAAKNKAIKSRVKTSVKKVEAAVAQKDMEAAKTALKAAIGDIRYRHGECLFCLCSRILKQIRILQDRMY